MSIKSVNRLISKIKKLPLQSIKEVENMVDKFSAIEVFKEPKSKSEKAIEFVLEKLQRDETNQMYIDRLKSYIQTDWEIIKEKQLLSKFLAKAIAYNEKPFYEFTGSKRTIRDNCSGTYFEVIFGLICTMYFLSHKALFDKTGECIIDIKINKFIAIPGSTKEMTPEIQIIDSKTGKAICIIELKKSLTNCNLENEYISELNEYKKLDDKILYFMVILNSSNDNVKSNKGASDCRVICDDFNKIGKEIYPEIISPIENILDEIYKRIKNL